MSITLFCLVKGNTSEKAFSVKISRDEPISELKKAIKAEKQNDFAGIDADRLKLWKREIRDDQDDLLSNLTLNDGDEFLATREIGDYWTEKPPKRHIHVIVKLPLLSLEEALSCIPPPITYSPDCNKKKTTTKVTGIPPTSVKLWNGFFDEVNRFRFDQQQPRFERPQFIKNKVVLNEEDVRVAIDVNICMTLNDIIGPDYVFSRKSTDTPGIPDFNCHLMGSLILVMEAKRKHVLEDMGEETFPEFYQTSNLAKDVVQQIYNYMGGNQLRYGILATYDNHWFLRREHKELWISEALPLESKSPPVLKAYAYITRQAKENTKSPHPQVLVSVHGDNNSRVLRSHSKSSSNSSLNQQPTSGTFANQQSSSAFGASNNPPVDQQKFSFTDFKFKGILGEGRSGKTLLCEFRGEMIALKSVDLSKAPPYVLEEMQKEVEIYKDLADIQGKYIPKLVCYGYYGGGMSFVIGMTIVGTSLSDQKIKKRQKTRAIKGLEAIHKHGILHNDIREENILINDNGVIYLIDFGMASRADTKKKRKLFEEEHLKYSNLLDRYNAHFVKNTERISKSRKCQMVS